VEVDELSSQELDVSRSKALGLCECVVSREWTVASWRSRPSSYCQYGLSVPQPAPANQPNSPCHVSHSRGGPRDLSVLRVYGHALRKKGSISNASNFTVGRTWAMLDETLRKGGDAGCVWNGPSRWRVPAASWTSTS
jgi:hypothetical protein